MEVVSEHGSIHSGTGPQGPDIRVSFEFFPPATPGAEKALWSAIERLAPVGPAFVSVTYGAGGSTRERTHATVERILTETPLVPAAHLTCVEATRAETDAVLRRYHEIGVRHLVALRGDGSAPGQGFSATADGYANALELVEGIRRIADFDVSVAGYPESHPEAVSPRADLEYLRRKVDAGADRVITQYFFDVGVYFDFVDRARAAGIEVPIVPGILPVTNFAKVVEFSARCGASVPGWLADRFDGLDADPEARALVAAATAAEQCTRLRDAGVDEFHFYTLNRAELTTSICRMLGLPSQRQPHALVA